MEKSLVDNWDFLKFGLGTKIPFRSYISSIDPTTAGAGVLIGGSQNTYKSLLGTVKVRDGLKRRGDADATIAGVISSFEWQVNGFNRIIRVANGKMQVEYDPGTGIQEISLLTGLTDDEMKVSFAPWYDSANARDILLFVNGQQEINVWSGGIGVVASAANTAGIIKSSRSPNYVLGGAFYLSAGGIGYTVGDILTVTGGGNADAQVRVTANGAATSVATVSVTAGGTNYAIGDIVRTGAASIAAGDAVFMVTGVAGTAVTTLSIVANGLGQATGAGQATRAVLTTLGGTGLTISIDSLGISISDFEYVNNGSGYATRTGSAEIGYATTGGTGTGATVNVFQIATGRITLSGTDDAFELGYAGDATPVSASATATGGSILVNGIEYSYNNIGDDGFSFIGISPDPTPTVGLIATSKVIVQTETASSNLFSAVFGETFTMDWMNVIGNQVFIGCYTSRIIFESDIDDYLDYSVPVLRGPGDSNLYILDSNSRGATSKGGQKGNAVLFGSQGDTYSIVNDVQTVQTAASTFAYIENQTIDKQTSSDLSSPIGQDFIASIGDTIIFVDESNQLRQFGTLRNLSTPVFPILSIDIYTELANSDLTGGALRAVAEQSGETVYITVPLTGTLYIYQIRQKVDEIGNLTAERIWQPPFIVGASRVAVVDGISYIYSNQNPQMYQLWNTGQYYDDSPSDEQLPYETHAIFAYLSLENRADQLYFDKVYYEGYMTEGTNLYNNIYQEYQGSKNIVTIRVNKPINPGKKLAKFFSATAAPSLGDVSLGEIPLGEGVTATGGASVPKFRAIRSAGATEVFEFALDMASYEANSQWELLCIGTNMQPTARQSTSIRG